MRWLPPPPGSSWVPTAPSITRSTSFGYAATFHVPRSGPMTVAFVGSWSHGLEIGVETAAWLAVAAALAGRRWWLDWWWGPVGRRGARRRRRGRFVSATVASEPLPVGSPEASDSMTQVGP